MYAYIKGKLVEKAPAKAIIEVGGLGYEINIPLSTYSKIGDAESCKLYTHFYVKEDIRALYGFFEEDEKKIFLTLIGVSGIGPSTAMMALSSMTSQELKKAIVTEDLSTIQSIKGVGKKTAQRLILELKDKFDLHADETSSSASTQTTSTVRQEALSALVALGINKAAAEKTINSILKTSQEQVTIEELIKQALKSNI